MPITDPDFSPLQLFWKKGARLSQRGFDGATPDEVAKARTMFKEMDDAVKSKSTCCHG